jgi:hypothetical protein
MTKEEPLRKSSHKLLLATLKFIPMVTAVMYFLNTLFAFFGIDTPLFSHISGMSLLPWLFILLATYVFRFCAYHRMFLWYILITDLLNILDYYVGIPMESFRLLAVHLLITCLFMFLILITYVKCHQEHLEKTV